VIAVTRTVPRRVAPSRAGDRWRPPAGAIAKVSKVVSIIAIINARIARA